MGFLYYCRFHAGLHSMIFVSYILQIFKELYLAQFLSNSLALWRVRLYICRLDARKNSKPEMPFLKMWFLSCAALVQQELQKLQTVISLAILNIMARNLAIGSTYICSRCMQMFGPPIEAVHLQWPYHSSISPQKVQQLQTVISPVILSETACNLAFRSTHMYSRCMQSYGHSVLAVHSQ